MSELAVHRPSAPDAPIPGKQWYGGCDPDYPLVDEDGICQGCGEQACPECGYEPHPWDGKCKCDV